jgi:acylphosphatase
MQKEQLKKLYAIVHGRVQGVGFRYSTISKARQLNITGYARNMMDGNVEVVAEGPHEKLNILLQWLYEGPSMSYVTNVDYKFTDYSGSFKNFNIKY